MPRYTPVDYDPFAPSGTPVDYDPFTTQGPTAADVNDGGFQARKSGALMDSDARRGELGVLNNPDGSVSTEISTTVTDPRVNNGRPTNIPLLVKGQKNVSALQGGEDPTQDQQEIAIRRAAERSQKGAALPSFRSIDEAVKAAEERSARKGGDADYFNSTTPNTAPLIGGELPYGATTPDQMQAIRTQSAQSNAQLGSSLGREIPRAGASGLGGLMQFGVDAARLARKVNPLAPLMSVEDSLLGKYGEPALLGGLEQGAQGVRSEVAAERQADKEAGLTTPLSRVGGGILEGAYQLPEYLLPEARIGRWTNSAIKAAPAAAEAAKQKYEQLVAAGVDPGHAILGAGAAGAVTEAGGIIPLGMGGDLAKRVVSALPVGAAQSEIGRQIENAALPSDRPDLQAPFDPEAMATSALSTGILAGTLGHGGAMNEGARLADQIIKSADRVAAQAPKPPKVETPVPPKQADMGNPIAEQIQPVAQPSVAESAPSPEISVPPETRLAELQATTRKTLKQQSEQELLGKVAEQGPAVYRGDVDAMRAKLDAAGLPKGSVVVENGQPAGLRFGRGMREKIDAVLNEASNDQARPPIVAEPQPTPDLPATPAPAVAERGPDIGRAPDVREAASPDALVAAYEKLRPEKPFHEMSAAELSAHSERSTAGGRSIEDAVLGDNADAWRKAQVASNSSNPDRADAGSRRLEEIESKLSPKALDALYGVGAPEGAFDDVADFRNAVTGAEAARDEADAASEMGRMLRKLGTTEGTDPATWDRPQQVAYAGMRALREKIDSAGWDSAAIQKQALQRAAAAFHDPNDAVYMLQRFLTPRSAEPAAKVTKTLPAPSRAKTETAIPDDYVPRLNELRAKRATLTPDETTELLNLHEHDRNAGKMGGKPMPGVVNRTAYEEAQAAGKLKPVQVFADADNFKKINDTFTHASGDDVLRELGSAYREAFGDGNVAHFGGDEFVPQADSEEAAHIAMKKVQDRMARHELVAKDEQGNVIATQKGVGVSYGVGPTKEAAERGQYADKDRRKAAGLRTDRADASTPDLGRVGDIAPRAVEGNGPQGGEDRGSAPKLSAGPKSGSGTVESARSAAAKVWGRDAISKLEKRGGLEFTTAADAVARKLGGHENVKDLEGVNGFYDPATGKAHVIADNLSPEKVAGVVSHEVFHANAEKFLGSERMTGLKSAASKLAARDEAIKAAYDKVPEDTPAAHRDEEALAYLAEDAPNHPLSKRLTDEAKLFLNRMGIPLDWLNANAAAVRKIAALNMRDASEGTALRAPAQDDQQSDPLYSKRQYTPEEKDALAKAGLPVDKPGLKERVQGVKEEWDKLKSIFHGEAQQSVFDRFHGIKAAEAQAGPIPAEQSGYVAARLSTGSAAVTEFALKHNGLKWEDGILAPDESVKGLLDALEPVKGRINDWLGWMAGRRAERLKAEGRENNFSDADIQALKTMAAPDQAKFEQAAKDYAALNKNVLDVAEKAGLLDPVTRAAWEHADYLPFFRDMGDEKTSSGTSSGLSGQKGVKRLKGGEQKLQDPLQNIIQNFHSLIDGAMKNEALKRTIDNVSSLGLIQDESYDNAPATIPMSQVKAILKARGATDAQIAAMPKDVFDGIERMLSIVPPRDPDVVRVMENGKPKYYRVLDPILLRSVSAFAMPERGAITKLMVMAKQTLTQGITASPAFMIRNWLRDTAHSYVINPNQMMPGMRAVKGVLQAASRDPTYRRLMASGAMFGHGRFDATSREFAAKNIRSALRSKGWSSKDIGDYMHSLVDTPAKLWELWHEVGGAAENANRIGTYDSTIARGEGRAKAALDAKDLLDFSMRGDSKTIQFLTDVLPFYNARMQGLYKLYRAGALPGPNMKMIVATKAAMLMAASTAYIWNIMSDPERKKKYEALEDYDKDNNWHFWVGDKHYRVPKPFEMGFLYGTTAEHAYRALSKDETMGKAIERMGANLYSTLEQNPVPQLFRPAMDVYANKDSFTGRAIENQSDDKKEPWDRVDVGNNPTSPIARAAAELTGKAATAAARATNPLAPAVGLSPKQMEYLWNQYTGAIGQYVLGMADSTVKIAKSKKPVGVGDALAGIVGLKADPGEPAMKDAPVYGWFVKKDDGTAYTRYQTEFYDAMKAAERIQGSLKSYEKEGETEKANAYAKENAPLLGMKKTFGSIQESAGKIRKQVNQIALDENLTPEEKRAKIDDLMRARNEMFKKGYDVLQSATHRPQ